MKKIGLIVGLIAASSFTSVYAAGVSTGVDLTGGAVGELCDGTAGGGKTPVNGGSGTPIAAADATFTRTGFDIQCSSNVFLSAQEVSGTLAVVASGSAKGNQSYMGSTNGGAITANAKCTGTNDACQDQDITDAIAAAIAASSS